MAQEIFTTNRQYQNSIPHISFNVLYECPYAHDVDRSPHSVQLVARNENTRMRWIGRRVACNLMHE